MGETNEQPGNDFDLNGELKKSRRLQLAVKRAEMIKESCQTARNKLKEGGGKFVEFCYSTDEKTEALQEFSEIRERIKKRYNVELSIPTKAEYLDVYKTMPLTDIIKARNIARSLEEQMTKLPPDFFKKLEIKKFILIKKVVYGQDKFAINRVNAMSQACGNGEMYFVESFPLFHEIYHRIDALHAGLQRPRAMEIDPKTLKIIGEECYKNEQQDNGTLWTKKGRSADEWQAEICMILFRQDGIDRERYKQWMEEEGGPERFEYIKSVLKSIDPRINEKYWEDLSSGNIDENYWKNP